jgi:hypothetical protein
MGSKTVFYQFQTTKSLSEVQDATSRALIPLGGQITRYGTGFQINQGKNGVQFSFSADFDAVVNITQQSQDKYEIICNIHWKMNALSILCLIIGLFVFGILWVIPLLSLFIDPSQAYQNALFAIPNILGQ